MSKDGRKGAQRKAPSAQLELWPALHEWVAAVGLEVLIELLEREREALCGPRYRHGLSRPSFRGGHVASSLVLGGRRVVISRPRVRRSEGGEVRLPSWERWSMQDPLEERMAQQMLLGVSTRRYASSLETLPKGVRERAVRRSAVSRRFISHTEHKLTKLISQSLAGLGLSVLMLDGVRFGTHVVLVAMGIDAQGKKHVLGLWEGATENAAACKALLANLAERGLPTDRAILVVIDGSKALARAVRDVFGARALIQRCREHKKRNVTDQLPQRMRTAMRQSLNQAYATRDVTRIQQLLEQHARKLQSAHPGAAAALREGLEETLTVTRLGLPDQLERALCSTNPIENLFSRVRGIARRVSRWRDGYMVMRWSAAALTDGQSTLHRIYGWKTMNVLTLALHAHDASLDRRASAA